MKTIPFLLAAVLGAVISFPAFAAPEKDAVKFTPVGTLLLDGALYSSPQKEEFPDGVAVPDVRLGMQASYDKWTVKLEASYAYGKVVLKDMWMQYKFSDTDWLRAGLQMQQFGYQNATAACMKVTMIEPISNTVFNEPHMIGLQWFHSADKYFTTLSAHVEPKSSSILIGKDEMSQQGYGFRTRLVGRPWHSEGKMLQIGFSGAFLSPQYSKGEDGDVRDAFSLNANFPTKVTLVSAIGTDVGKAMNQWKFTPELMACYGRVAVESQYFFMQINRRENLQAFRASGAYATLRGIVLGKDYQYNMALAGIDTPRKGSLEAVASYNYTTLSDRKAGIFGGRVNDLSVGLNYYFNKYIIGKFRYSYTHRWDRSGVEPMDLNAFQIRLQAIF
ncbi:MAG: porin [Muribaculum sp.]|nr:porin [Muribaculum sp.]